MRNKICDIHAHIVPAIDDGAVDLNMAIEMLRSAYKQGVRSIICTSHSYSDMERYMKNFETLRAWAKKENVNINLYSGCEVDGNLYTIEDLVFNLNNKIFPTINETKYVLIEFNPSTSANDIVNYVAELHQYGYNAILAHTERYPSLFEDCKWISLLQENGCLLQVNAYSLQNESSKQIRDFARKLLAEKCVTFIGSDAHRTTHRPYAVQNGVNYIYEHCDIEYAKDICYKNAEYILNIK